MEILISREARDKYKIDRSYVQPAGSVIFPGFKTLQEFAGRLGNARTGEINAIGLLYKIFHYMVKHYLRQRNPGALETAVGQMMNRLGREAVETTLQRFVEEFPPAGNIAAGPGGASNRASLLEGILVLRLLNNNPACAFYKKELFDDTALKQHTAYLQIIKYLEEFFLSQPKAEPGDQDLLTFLKAPSAAASDSLTGQLEYIRRHWKTLPEELMSQVLSGLDILKEEEKFRGPGPGEPEIPDFSEKTPGHEFDNFTPDRHWMPKLVLIAKNIYVWLAQLSKKYDASISRLDQVPDRELEELANRGFTGLWLIGIWERSRASQRIKQMCGNPEALASAYSIYRYSIAGDLGGEAALSVLKSRAWKYGIRLGSDMVPNHMSIDSPWVTEHPEWFLSLDYCPFPSYTFDGPDLSADPRVGIFLEDHYYDRTDAAVVFKWVNRRTGEERYIYHGNDGTTMPWNDTAQLNYLLPEVREAVIQAIQHTAGYFPIIRFDAAMTLTQQHYQRLWFPEPGTGGDIPSRAGHGMDRRDFHRLMPEEFWRQVVDRLSSTQSDTLLLAEAFWLMESYFVRSLGMHRVYNSAFMNFLKNEENSKFRHFIKNLLLLDPEILNRFVNFMNNPDEETAVAQFGKQDKYFGVCTLMATFPGLPMFGHGQVEGFAEKYGMEYRRAYLDETPDQTFIRRHELEIAPLLKKREYFARADGFLFYDFYTQDGRVNDDVIAFSNCFDGQCRLVIVHNKYAETAGWLKTSAPYRLKGGGTKNTGPHQQNLAEALGITPGPGCRTIFHDPCFGTETSRTNGELVEKGLYVELKAYEKKVFTEIYQKKKNA
jgi:glycosidase